MYKAKFQKIVEFLRSKLGFNEKQVKKLLELPRGAKIK
tara:strand:- start:2 stop:115 length:114 start_codon:yes stop_codon:yes gene_type:complete